MMSLPDDVLNIIIENIMPTWLNNKLIVIYEEYTSCIGHKYNNGWKSEYTVYSLLAHLSDKHNISNKKVYNALITLLTLCSTNTILRGLVNSYCKYDISLLLKTYINIFKDKHRQKMINVHSDILHHSNYINATHCNSGCINCAMYLPCWWPSLSGKDFLKYIPEGEIIEWVLKTDTYIRDGCCSFECYRVTRPADHSDPYNTLLQLGQHRELFCYGPDCDKSINPVDAAVFHIKFCNEDCKYAYEEQNNYRSKRRRLH